MKLYNCKVSCSFEIDHDFGEDDIERQMVDGAEKIRPSHEALACLASELNDVLDQGYCVYPIGTSVDSNTLQRVDEVE